MKRISNYHSHVALCGHAEGTVEDYVKEATGIRQMNREGGYGYFIWKYRTGFSINGKWKQKCYVLPEEQMVVTYLSHIEEELPELKASMEKHILEISSSI